MRAILRAKASTWTEPIFAGSWVASLAVSLTGAGSLAGLVMVCFITAMSVPSSRIGPDRVLPQGSIVGMVARLWAGRRPCCGHISRLGRLWYNSLSLHRFPVPSEGFAEHAASACPTDYRSFGLGLYHARCLGLGRLLVVRDRRSNAGQCRRRASRYPGAANGGLSISRRARHAAAACNSDHERRTRI